MHVPFDTKSETKKARCLPVRYLFGVMSMFGVMVAYVMRACLSIAITQMVVTTDHPATQTTYSIGEVFPSPDSKTNGIDVNFNEGEFNWDEKTQGFILSAFYYGYILTHIPGGLLAQKFGGKHVLGLGILSTAIFTLITPIIAYMGSTALIVLRFLEGIGEGVTFPALCTMLAQWSPPSERTTLTSAAFAGAQIGTLLANLGGGLVLQYVPGGWEAVFYIFGCAGIIWFILWCFLCYNDPSSHPFISESEKLYLKDTIGETERKKDLKMPWSDMLTSIPVWALVIAEVGHDWALFMMVSDLPKYMNDVMKFDYVQNGLWSSMPYLATWIFSLVASALADWLLKYEYLSCTNLRKIFATIGAVGPAAGVILASYAGCSKIMATVLFTIGMGFMGFCYCSLRVNALDLSPNFSGTIMAFVNGTGCISGMLTPIFTGLLTPNKSLTEWTTVFWIMAIILIGTNFIYIFFGSGELQDWNKPKQDDTEKSMDTEHNRMKSNEIALKYENPSNSLS